MTLNNLVPTLACRYTNYTDQLQIVRISNIADWFFERVVLPQSSILFEAFPDAQLEIHTPTVVSAILSDMIACHRLAQNAPPATFEPPAAARLRGDAMQHSLVDPV